MKATKQANQNECNTEVPPILMKKIGEIDRVELLAPWHGHNEIHIQDFEERKCGQSNVKEFFQRLFNIIRMQM